MRAGDGLLIVNADDWGGQSSSTDPILTCFEAGAVTSTTAMVHMADSERAAEIALAHRLPVGLHLNLTLAFDSPDSPAPVRDRQARVVELLGGGRAHRAWRPSAGGLVRRAIADQLVEFERLYGRPPTHIDGHQHVHQSPAVLLSGRLPRDLPKRRAVNWPPGGGLRSRLTHGVRNLFMVGLDTTDWFVSISVIHPALGGAGLDELLDRSATDSVEIMVHPQWTAEFELLTSPEWLTALRGRPLGSFADLPR